MGRETNFEEILPAGSVVTLNIMKKEYSDNKFLITRRFVTEKKDDLEYYEYEAMLLPVGTKDGKNIMFSSEHIKEILHYGYIDEKEIKVINIIKEGIKKAGMKKKEEL